MKRSGLRWLQDLGTIFPLLIEQSDWEMVTKFDTVLYQALEESSSKYHDRLLILKKELASLGFGGIDVPLQNGGQGRSSLVQMLVQFICGYHDLDLRDVAHIGHGRLILRNGSQRQTTQWREQILRGSLVGVAITEPTGGTLIQAMRTNATKGEGKNWILSGEKCWISRIDEASVFVVFFKIKDSDAISAAVIDPRSTGLRKETFRPEGLRGWSWGRLIFDDVIFTDEDFLGASGTGLDIFRDHFSYYRPMVAITALGGVAAMFDDVMEVLSSKIKTTSLDSVRDSAWESLGRGFIEIHSAVLSALVAAQLVGQNNPRAEVWARSSKAYSTETAYGLASRLAVFAGARGYQEQSRICKTHRDLRGLLYADGIVDALLRSAGRKLYASEWLNVKSEA